jgi:hypothetical protein
MKELCSFEITVTLQTIPLCGGMGSETSFIIREVKL